MLITAEKQSLHTHTHKHTPQHTYVLKLRWRVIDGRIFSLLFLAILVENNSAQLFVYCGIMFPRCFGLLCIRDIFHTLTTEDHSRKPDHKFFPKSFLGPNPRNEVNDFTQTKLSLIRNEAALIPRMRVWKTLESRNSLNLSNNCLRWWNSPVR